MNQVFDPIVKKLQEKPDVDITTIVIYTDRGLCGPCNNGINRMLDKETLSNQNVVVWGEKGCAGFEKSKHKSKVVLSAHPNIKTPLSFLEVTNLVQKVLEKVYHSFIHFFFFLPFSLLFASPLSFHFVAIPIIHFSFSNVMSGMPHVQNYFQQDVRTQLF